MSAEFADTNVILYLLDDGRKADRAEDMRTTKSLGGVSQEFGTETTEFASKTGEELSGKMTEKAKQATDKATNAEKKVA